MVWNKSLWDPTNAVGLSKQKKSSWTDKSSFFWSPIASQHNSFRTMWPDRTNGLLSKTLLMFSTAIHMHEWSQLRFRINRLTHKSLMPLFSVFTSHVIKIKIITIQWKKSRVWDTIDDWYINNLAKNQVSAIFHSRVICSTVSPKFIGLCMETPCLSFWGTQTWRP